MTPVKWFSAKDAQLYLGHPTLTAFHRWVQRDRRQPRPRLKVHWLGRRMRFRQVDLDACLEPEPAPVTAQPRLVRRIRS